MSLLRSLNFVPQRFLDRGGIWSDVGFRNISGSLHDSRVHERRKVQELLLTDRRPCPVKKRWWGLTWSKRTEERIKSRGIWGGKVTRQLNAEDEAGVEDNLRILAWGTGLVVMTSEVRQETQEEQADCQVPLHGILQARILEWVSHSLLQGIFLTQESNQGFLRCRRILYQPSYQGNPTNTQH